MSSSNYRKKKRRKQFISEINVTPFVDVMLVLLIIFIVTAPMLVTGVEINLPKTSASSLPAAENKSLTITLTAEGQINIDNKIFTVDELLAKLTSLKNDLGTDARIWVRSDKNLNYGKVLEVIAVLQQVGFSNVALASLTAD
ncbi:ExbD/TolR family protein [Bartonella sp. DGB1]|uniref:ExbD/TolR family protein n=1 Tax=Bartonella sp. DGB1 TaxID=3239807 RepID=UPI003523B974